MRQSRVKKAARKTKIAAKNGMKLHCCSRVSPKYSFYVFLLWIDIRLIPLQVSNHWNTLYISESPRNRRIFCRHFSCSLTTVICLVKTRYSLRKTKFREDWRTFSLDSFSMKVAIVFFACFASLILADALWKPCREVLLLSSFSLTSINIYKKRRANFSGHWKCIEASCRPCHPLIKR